METKLRTQVKAAPARFFTPKNGSALQRKCACGGAPGVAGKCEGCNRKQLNVQRSTANQAEPSAAAPSIVQEVLRSPGQPLDAATRAFMEPRFGHDFSQVRVHTDASAAESAQAVNASAYTVGRDVVFGTGEYSPNTTAGQQIIAHELSHVLQQANGMVAGRASWGGMRVSDPGDNFERQADRIAAGLFSRPTSRQNGQQVLSLPSGPGNTIQRQAVGQSRPAAPVSRGPAVVEDGALVAAGQMSKSEFLAALRASLLQACETELAQAGRSSHGCPYILRTIEYYTSRPLSKLMRLVQAFGHPPTGADARGMIQAVTERARVAARKLAATGNQRVQAMAESEDGTLAPHDPIAIREQLGSGSLLDNSVQGQMERSFGMSFGSVRVHTDSTAARLNTELGARAFTIGSDIAFAAGQYRPGTLPGDALIAHELANTLQQDEAAPGASSGVTDQGQEREADRAALSALGGREGLASSLRVKGNGVRIQRDGVGEIVLAAILLGGEVGATDVAVTEGVVLVSEAVAPEVLGATIPEVVAASVPEAIGATAPEVLGATTQAAAPAALETTVAASSSSAASTAVRVAAAAGAATTLSSDSSTSEEDPQQNCLKRYPLPCEEEISMEEQVQEFIDRQGYGYEALEDCHRYSTHGPGIIGACNGTPGETWHCDVAPYSNPTARVTKPGGVVSIFSCTCCREDGSTGFEWTGAHWSPGRF